MLSLRQRLASATVMGLVTASVLLGVGGCAQESKTPEYIPFPNLEQVGLRKVWERQVVVAPGEKIQNLWRVGDSVYVATDEGRMVRINAASGVQAWDILVGEERTAFHAPVELPGGSQVLLSNRGNFYVVNKETGRQVASQRLDFLASTSPVVVGDTLCVGSNDYFRGMYLDRLGGQRWAVEDFHDTFASTPAVFQDSVVLASRDGKLWRVNGSDGNWVWKDRKTNGEVTAALATDQKNVYVPCADGYLYAFNLFTGGEVWDSKLDGKLDQKAIPVANAGSAGSEVLLPASGKGLYAIAPADGAIRWVADGVTQVASVSNNTIWALDDKGDLRSMRADTGEIVSSTPVKDVDRVGMSPDNWVIVMNKAGVIDGFQPNP